MTKTYPTYENPTMIYNSENEYTIIDASQLSSAMKQGWRMTHSASIHEPLKEFLDEVSFPPEEPEVNPAVVAITKAKKKI